jgi:integrase
VLTLNEVMTLADAIDQRYRMLVLLAVFASLRWGELMGLRKTDFDLNVGLVQVERAVSLVGARQLIKKPKTSAGVRTVAVPMWLLPDLEQHFPDYSEAMLDGRVFVGPSGVTPARPNFSPIWARALAKAGMTGVHFHDLRHAGNHFAAVSGGVNPRADGPDGARQCERGARLSAQDSQPRSRDRRLARCHGRRTRGGGLQRFGAR